MKITKPDYYGTIVIIYAPTEEEQAAHAVNNHVRKENGANGLYYVADFGKCFYKLKLRINGTSN